MWYGRLGEWEANWAACCVFALLIDTSARVSAETKGIQLDLKMTKYSLCVFDKCSDLWWPKSLWTQLNHAPPLPLNPSHPKLMTSYRSSSERTMLQEDTMVQRRTESGGGWVPKLARQPERRMETRQPQGPLLAWWWWDAMGPDPAEAPASVLAD